MANIIGMPPGTKFIVPCKYCGDNFELIYNGFKNYLESKVKYCSRKCYVEGRIGTGERIKIICNICKKVFEAHPRCKRKYCSQKCVGKALSGIKLSKEHRDKISKALKGRIRSKEHCKNLSISHIGSKNGMYGRKYSSLELHRMSLRVKGKNNPNYGIMGSKSPNWNPDREWVKKRRIVFTFMVNSINRLLYNKDGRKSEEILGYTKEELMAHLEFKFKKRMTWFNHGANKYCWQIDHIKPISVFLKEGIEDPKIISALSNLQPLWALENKSKFNKWVEKG